MPTQITVSADTDYTSVPLNDVGTIQFANASGTTVEAIFSAAQFNGTTILNNVLLIGTAGNNLIRIKGSSINASGWQFQTWGTAGDAIIFDGAAAAINTITGSSRADIINGGSLADTLNGGDGADTMTGGAEADIYVVDNAGDSVVEAAGGLNGWTDLVQSSVTFTLTANVEDLTLTGSANINATGNSAIHSDTNGNIIYGNAGDNYIDGKLNNDDLYGGLGNDNFVFSTAISGGANHDAIFTGLAIGTLSAAAFHLGSVAADASDRIIVDINSIIYFDPDGTGVAAQIHFVGLGGPPLVTAADFVVF